MPRIILIAAFIVAGVIGCHGTNVTADELAGTWVMTDASQQNLPAALQKASARIVLDTNGIFTASDMALDGLLPGDFRRVQLATGSGVWKLVSREGRSEIQLDFYLLMDNREQTPFGTQLYISKFWTPARLFYFLGDPDQGQRVEFEKR